MTNSYHAGAASTAQIDTHVPVALQKSLETLFGENPDRGELQTLHLVAATDHNRDIVYALVSPHGLMRTQWEELLGDAFGMFAAIEEARIDHDLSDFSQEEMDAYDADNLRGVILLVAARRGWTVFSINDKAWGRSALDI